MLGLLVTLAVTTVSCLLPPQRAGKTDWASAHLLEGKTDEFHGPALDALSVNFFIEAHVMIGADCVSHRLQQLPFISGSPVANSTPSSAVISRRRGLSRMPGRGGLPRWRG
eukprot:1548132-Pyramimonas_sp.AAC.1